MSDTKNSDLCSGWQRSQTLVNLLQQVLKLLTSDGCVIAELIQGTSCRTTDLCSYQPAKTLGAIFPAAANNNVSNPK